MKNLKLVITATQSTRTIYFHVEIDRLDRRIDFRDVLAGGLGIATSFISSAGCGIRIALPVALPDGQ